MDLDEYAATDRDARIALSLLSPPAMPVTGQLVARYGPQETLGFATGDSPDAGVDAASLGVRRARISLRVSTPSVSPSGGVTSSRLDSVR